MDREILFRLMKKKSDGSFEVVGYEFCSMGLWWYSHNLNGTQSTGAGAYISHDRKDQFTGLTLADGTKIFENDIVEKYVITRYIETYDNGQYVSMEEFSVIKITSKVSYENGAFIIIPMSNFVIENKDGFKKYAEKELLSSSLPFEIEYEDASYYNDGFVKLTNYYEGIILHIDDVKKLLEFKVIRIEGVEENEG